MSEFVVQGFDKLANLIVKMAERMPEVLKKEFSQLPERMVNRALVQEWHVNWAGTAHQGHVTGRLKSSVKPIQARAVGDTLECGISANTEYAAIHEYGGRTSPHVIEPRTAGALFWPGASHPVKRVNHPGSVIREKRYLRNPVEHEALTEFPERLMKALAADYLAKGDYL